MFDTPKYVRFSSLLEASRADLCIDTGHVARCGIDVLQLLPDLSHPVVHVHLKDMDREGEWAPIGKGTCNFPAIVALLAAQGFEGWLVCEEEADAAKHDPYAAIVQNLEVIQTLLGPLCS